MIFPTWQYHKEKGPKLFTTEAEFVAAGAGWEDTPAAFEKADGKIGSESGHKGHEDGEPLEKMTVAELKAFLLENGKTEEDFEGLKKSELLEMAQGL